MVSTYARALSFSSLAPPSLHSLVFHSLPLSSLSRSLSHTHSHTNSFSLSLSLPPSFSLIHTHTHIYTHTHLFILRGMVEHIRAPRHHHRGSACEKPFSLLLLLCARLCSLLHVRTSSRGGGGHALRGRQEPPAAAGRVKDRGLGSSIQV
jgi:hypothetical protein